jgi:ABC-type transport system involved in multi-copper enzyme maturation permease subunit
MIRLLAIELRKILPYRMFWLMAGMYILALAFIFYGFPSLIDYFSLRSDSPEIKLLKNFIYNFPDIWQNLTWVASMRFFIKILPGIILVMLVTNEFSYGTVRLAIINGWSRLDFLLGKISLAAFISLVSTLLVFISGTILGMTYSSSISAHLFFAKMAFLGGYFIELFLYLLFGLMVGLILKRTGAAISVLFVYPIIEIIIQEQLADTIKPFLPISSLNHIIRTPNTSLIQFSSPDFNIELQNSLAFQDIAVATGYGILFIAVSCLVMKKRDL